MPRADPVKFNPEPPGYRNTRYQGEPAVFLRAVFCAASQTSASPTSAIGSSEPRFNQVQPCVVIIAPEANELTAMVEKTQRSIAPCALFFSSGR